VLEIAVLGLLNESPMHGYELRKRLSSLLGAFRAFSYGSLYPTLRRLQEAGWISEEPPLDEPPATAGFASRSKRGKKVYRLTAEGKERFATLLSEVGPESYDDEGFGTRLAFFAQTRSDIRLQILEGRRRRMADQADGMRTGLARTRERLDRYTVQLQEHGLESADREVRWLTELIESERTTRRDSAVADSEAPAPTSSTTPEVQNNDKETPDGFGNR
jgi:DNA-binding PadR family transcriptional regulator